MDTQATVFEALARRLGELERHVADLHRLVDVNTEMQCARMVRELLADAQFAGPRLERHGHKVYSQNDEDGIIEEIFRRIGVTSRSFVELGVGDGRECNSLKLLLEGWSGLWIEASARDCERIRRVLGEMINLGQLELREAAVTAANIDRMIAESAVAGNGELDLLSVDIDGNDYHVLQAIANVRPRAIVIEYNAKFPPPMDLVPPYDPSYRWDGSDYMGASLEALAKLALRRGYRLVGTNITGANAFLVREDLVADRFCEHSAVALYNPPRYWLTAGFVVGHDAGERFHYTTDAALAKEAGHR